MPHSDPFPNHGRRRGDDRRDTVDTDVLSALTGVRSGKNSYYRQLQLTEERMTSAVRSLEIISSALAHTRDDPRGLLHEIVRTAFDHLGATWTMMALRSTALPDLRQRFLALGPDKKFVGSDISLPTSLRLRLRSIEHDLSTEPETRDGWVRVPMTLDGQVLGQLVAVIPRAHPVEHEDLWVLRILVNQAAVAMHTASMHATAAMLRAEAQDLYDNLARSSKDLQTRTAELEDARGRLHQLHQHELLDAERHRIALELHDSVAQYVLSAGFAVDVCRADAADRGDADVTERLGGAKDLIARAGDQIRSAIYALDHEPAGGESAGLPALLEGLAAQHRGDTDVTLRVEGRPTPLGPDAVRALARIAGEALFNIANHAKASQIVIRLRYRPSVVTMSVADNGGADPRELRRLLRLEQRGSADGRHRGLAGMAARADGIGARFGISRSPLGGVRIDVNLPITRPDKESS